MQEYMIRYLHAVLDTYFGKINFILFPFSRLFKKTVTDFRMKRKFQAEKKKNCDCIKFDGYCEIQTRTNKKRRSTRNKDKRQRHTEKKKKKLFAVNTKRYKLSTC